MSQLFSGKDKSYFRIKCLLTCYQHITTLSCREDIGTVIGQKSVKIGKCVKCN